MPLSGFNVKLGSESKDLLVGTFLVANAFVWYLSAFRFLWGDFAGNSLLAVISVNVVCLIITAFFVTLLMNRFKQRLVFLKYWILAGILLSVSYAFLDFTNILSSIIASGFLGFYFGVGMPICMGYFAATSKSENRGKSGAIIILMIGFGFPILTTIGGSQNLVIATALTAWRFLALGSLFVFKPLDRTAETKNAVSYRSVIGNKTFLLYLVPWFMFVLINELAMQINADYFSKLSQAFSNNYLIIENVLSGISAVVCGFLADKKGRKRIALFGFALLGIGYAALGLFNSGNVAGNVASIAAWFYVCADGIAWGAFAMLFLVTIWGDIAHERNSEKYYFVGVLPYLISNLAGHMMGSVISKNILDDSVGTVFSFASFFLFIAILPLAYAPETLSEKIMSRLDISDYVAKALEKVKKEDSRKPQVQAAAEENEESQERSLGSSLEDAEAKKLAEKYYY